VAQRGPLTLTPSISVSEEYNDNIFADNRTKQSDFITSVGPALELSINQPSYQLRAGYSASAEIYAKEHSLSNAFNRQNFIAEGSYRATATLTLAVSEFFSSGRDTALVARDRFSTGRQKSWSNAISPRAGWQMTPQDTLTLGANYTVLRYEGSGSGNDSDTYVFDSAVTHAFTPRLAGSIGYSFTYLDSAGEDSSLTHNPNLGVSYQFTRTLTGAIRGGPAITTIGNETFVEPGGTASLVQTLSFGSASLQYVRGVSVAGGFGGANETQTVSAALTVLGLQRGLLIVLGPSYSTSQSLSSRQTENVDVQTYAVALGVSYQLARFTTLFGGYTFLRQRTGGSSTSKIDVDQNRVRFGLLFGYPINFD